MENRKIQQNKAMTLVEVIVAMAIFALIFSAVVPQLRCIENSWAGKQSQTELLQNGRIVIDHITANLNAASQLTLVSNSTNTQGYIQYLDNDGNELRYELVNGTVRFGVVGENMPELARQVSELQFTCHDAYNLDLVTTDPNAIRTVKVAVKVKDTQTNQSQSFWAQAYIRANVLPQTGSMGSRYVYDLVDGKGPAIANIDGSHYLLAYHGWADLGYAQILGVDALTNTVAPSSPGIFDSWQAMYPALCKIDNTRYLCAYQGPYDNGWAVVLTVNTGTLTLGKGTSYCFDSSAGYNMSLSQIDATRYIAAYRGYGNYGYAVILTVNPATNTIAKGTTFKFEGNRCYNPEIKKIDATRFLCVYRGESDDGWAAMLTANVSSGTVSKSASFEFDPVKCDWPSVEAIDSTHYLCTYTGVDDDGYAVVLTVNTATNTISKGSSFEFDTKNGRYTELYKISANRFLCAYQAVNYRGWAQILNATAATSKVSKESTIVFDNYRCYYPSLAQVGAEKFVCAYQGYYDRGMAVILNTDLQIIP